MLLQGLDYYDYVSSHVKAIARLYGKFSIDPTQSVRLFLIAPSFSQSLITRCKWIDVPITLFTYKCIKLEDCSPENSRRTQAAKLLNSQESDHEKA